MADEPESHFLRLLHYFHSSQRNFRDSSLFIPLSDYPLIYKQTFKEATVRKALQVLLQQFRNHIKKDIPCSNKETYVGLHEIVKVAQVN